MGEHASQPQFGMRAEADKAQNVAIGFLIDQDEIRANVAVPEVRPRAAQRVAPYCSAAQSDHSETLAKRSRYRGSCSKYVFMGRSNRRPFCASDSDVARMWSRTCWKLLTWHNAERASTLLKAGMACGSGAVHNVGLSDPLGTCRRELTPANGRERIGDGSARGQPGIARTRYLGRSGQASAMM